MTLHMREREKLSQIKRVGGIENKQKTLEKILFYMNSLLIRINKAKVKLINMTLPYQCRKVKIVAGHPALILY